MNKLFTGIILALTMFFITVISFGTQWVVWSPEQLIEKVNVVVDATVKYPEGSSEDHIKKPDENTYYEYDTDFKYPVVLIIHEIISNNDILDEGQKEINLIIDNGKLLNSTAHLDFLFFDGERAIFLLKGENKNELQPFYYPTYKLLRDGEGGYIEKDSFINFREYTKMEEEFRKKHTNKVE